MRNQTVTCLEDIWPLQAELNRRAGFDTLSLGGRLAAAGVPNVPGGQEDPGPRGSGPPLGPAANAELLLKIGRALKNYIDALLAECHELQECLSWKHWYREAREGRQYELKDVQNARVEAVDMLFFWVSICQLLGMQPEDVYRLYAKKLGINHRRQDEDRTQGEHASHEQENRHVT